MKIQRPKSRCKGSQNASFEKQMDRAGQWPPQAARGGHHGRGGCQLQLSSMIYLSIDLDKMPIVMHILLGVFWHIKVPLGTIYKGMERKNNIHTSYIHCIRCE